MSNRQYAIPSRSFFTSSTRKSFNQEGQSELMPKNAILRHYVRVIRDRSMYILFFTIIFTSLTYFISISLPPVYQATTLIKVDTITNDDTTSAPNDAILVTSPEVLQIATQRLSHINRSQLQQALSSSIINHTRLLLIQSQATSAQQATRIADVVATSFIQVQENKETAHLQTALQELAPQISSIRKDLDADQQRLNTLKAEQSVAQNISQQKSLLDIDQSNYNQLLTTYSQLRIQKLQVPDMLSIMQPAVASEQPLNPHTWLHTLLATIISISALCLLVLLHDWLAPDVAHVNAEALPFIELLETPQPWQRNELVTQAVQPKFSLPVTKPGHAQHINSLLHKSVAKQQQQDEGFFKEARRGLTDPLPLIKVEPEVPTEEESMSGPDTSQKLAIMKNRLTHPFDTTGAYQFKSPYQQEDRNESREQLT